MGQLLRLTILNLILIASFSLVMCPSTCPSWTYNNSDGDCQCGRSLGDVVLCDNSSKEASLLFCHCMNYNNITMETTVGSCLSMCKIVYQDKCISYNKIFNNTENLNDQMCGNLNRTGQLCGACSPNNGVPVYSYSLGCVECDESHFWYNFSKYIAIAFLPLTLFYMFTMLFKISAMSDSMVAYVFTCQVVTMPATSKLLINSTTLFLMPITKAVVALFSIWNLDFLRSVYTPFCLHPKLSTMQVIALDYLIAVYPMLLIVLTYIAVALHDRYPIIVTLWRPMQRVFTCIRKEWNIRGSLVQGFATFLVLSYVKILNVSFDLLTPVYMHSMRGNYTINLFNDGEINYFGMEHLPFALLAIVMLTVFNILPVILLLVYPCYCCSKIYRCVVKHEALAIFMNTFQGSYHTTPKIYRNYSAIYFIMRIILLTTCAAIHDFTYVPITGFYFLLLSTLVTFLRPYRNDIYNDIDSLFFLFYGFCYFLLLTHLFIRAYDPAVQENGLLGVWAFLISIPVLYCIFVLSRFILPQKMQRKARAFYENIFTRKAWQEPQADEVEADVLPYRLECEGEYTPLLKPETN